MGRMLSVYLIDIFVMYYFFALIGILLLAISTSFLVLIAKIIIKNEDNQKFDFFKLLIFEFKIIFIISLLNALSLFVLYLFLESAIFDTIMYLFLGFIFLIFTISLMIMGIEQLRKKRNVNYEIKFYFWSVFKIPLKLVLLLLISQPLMMIGFIITFFLTRIL